MKNWIPLILLLAQTAFGSNGTIQQQDIKTAAQCTAASAPLGACLPLDQQVYVTANGINSQLSTAITNGLIGGGSGSGSGINLLSDPGFEIAGSLGSYWTATGGTLVEVTSGSNLLIGNGSATYQATATAQEMNSNLYPVQNGLKGTNCAASMLYLGGDSNLFFTVSDGTNTLASQQLVATLTPTPVALTFQCPSSGSVQISVVSIASSAIMAMDQMYLGSNVITQVSQANYFGGVILPAGCALSNSGSPSHTDLLPSGCTGATVLGNVTSFDGVTTGYVTVNNMPPGEYYVVWQGIYESSDITTNSDIIPYDGTTYGQQVNLSSGSPTTGGSAPATITAHFSYPTAGARSFWLQGAGSVNHGLFFNSTAESFSIYRFPSQSEQAVRPETINWNIQTTLAGQTIDLGVSNTALIGPDFIDDGSNSLVVQSNTGSLPGLQACSGTTSPVSSGACSGGNNEAGIAFTPPAIGNVEVCAAFNISMEGASTSSIYDSFLLIQTAGSDSGTVLTTGSNESSISYVATSTIQGVPVKMCEIFPITSLAQVAFRLQYYHTVSNSPTAHSFQANATGGGTPNNMQWTVRPITQNIPAPVLVGSVMSPSSGVIYQAAAFLNSGGAIVSQTGNWLTFSSAVTGKYIYTLNSGSFGASTNMVCTANFLDNGTTDQAAVWFNNAGFGTIDVRMASTGTPINLPLWLMCTFY